MNICFITAIYGNYEASCKKFTKQTVPTDFICFTDNADIKSNGWIVDTTPYHTLHNDLDTGEYTNSLKNNRHSFCLAKFYKQSFRKIPRLQKYHIIVWIDGTIEIIYHKTSAYILENILSTKIIGWHHEWRNGNLFAEVQASMNEPKYISSVWTGQEQPYQDVLTQYNEYLSDGYDPNFFKSKNRQHLGVWITCFVAFLQHDEKVQQFLDTWYIQTLKYTTQDQISFPYICQKMNIIPYTLPNKHITGDHPHHITLFYIKHLHGS